MVRNCRLPQRQHGARPRSSVCHPGWIARWRALSSRANRFEETKNQVARLDQVFKMLGKEPQGVKCPAIDGLISEADAVAGEVADKDVLDRATGRSSLWAGMPANAGIFTLLENFSPWRR